MTAAVLGPELDLFLKSINEELKGKTQLDEPYVEKKTIVRAVREQNKVIMTLQDRILKMEELEEEMQKSIHYLQERVKYFEIYTKKVDDIDALLSEKIPIVDKMNETVKKHDVSIDCINAKQQEQEHLFSSFKEETQDTITKTKEEIQELQETIEILPKTIIISSKQVEHSQSDELVTNTSSCDENQNCLTPMCLADVIGMQRQILVDQTENAKQLEEKVNVNHENQLGVNQRVDSTLTSLVQWKEEQSSVDLVVMKKNQVSMKESIDSLETELHKKVAKSDVDAKLEAQFHQIADHLQTALSSVEHDEADFKSVTDALSQMCESLREKKADKSEVGQLRRDFIENQIDGGKAPMPYGGSSLDNEELREILADYPTRATLKEALDNKADKVPTISRIERTDSMVKDLERVLNELYTITNEEKCGKAERALEQMSNSLHQQRIVERENTFETITVNDNNNPEERNNKILVNNNNNVVDDTTIVKKGDMLSLEPIRGQSLRKKEDGSAPSETIPPAKSQEETIEAFPSSSITGELLRYVDPDPDDNGYVQDFLQKRRRTTITRPKSSSEVKYSSSSLLANTNNSRTPLTMRKYSLPVISTTVVPSVTTQRSTINNGSNFDPKMNNDKLIKDLRRKSPDCSLPPDGISFRRKPIVVPKSEGKLYSGLRHHEKIVKVDEYSRKVPIIIRTNIT